MSPTPWHVVPDHPDCDGRFAVLANDTDELVSCHDTKADADKHVAALYAETGEGDEDSYVAARAMSTASINDLPDSAFAYIEPGGTKDADGRTTPRSLRHFPVHDEAHCRNALARASQSPFGDKAMPKIRAAARRFGITVAAAAATSLVGVELARPGTWHIKSGKRTFTEANLRDAADFFAATGNARIPLGFGHTDDRFDGDPAWGWVDNIRYTEDDQGPVLLGDLVDVDDWVAAAAPRRWPNRSVEGFANLGFQGRDYSLALTSVKLLGATPPGMPALRSLADLRAAVAAAAAHSHAEPIAASALPTPQTPASEADVSTNPTKETGMGQTAQIDPALIREALGLDDDASDDEVRTALVAAGLAESAPEPIAASGSQQEIDQRIAAAAAKGGLVTFDAAQLQTFREGMIRASALEARLNDMDRDNVINAAVTAGKFPPSRREHYERMWRADPKGTRELITSLAAGLVPVTASGYSDDGEPAEDDLDREIARLSPPTRIPAREGA